jgi:hypothetical protein
MHLELQRGDNEITLLVDNLGRFNYGFKLGESKGLWGDLFAAAPVRPRAWRIKPGDEKDFSRRVVPRNQQYTISRLRATPMAVCETSFTLARPMPVHLQFADLPHAVAMFCNDRLVSFTGCTEGDFGDAILSNETKKGANKLKLLVWGDVTAKELLASFKLYRLEDNLTAGRKWRFKPWSVPVDSHARVKGLPGWYAAEFRKPSADLPLFVHVRSARKGQIYLNGHNVGRFWRIGPQDRYYLPECWLEEKNELVVFDEYGLSPRNTALEFKPLGPYG